MYFDFNTFQEMVPVPIQIYNESEFKETAANGTTGCHDAKPLPNNTDDVPYYIIGDNVFDLRTKMMKPFTHRTMDREERIFRCRLSKARCVLENAFGILLNRFGILLSIMEHLVSTVRFIVETFVFTSNSTKPYENSLSRISEPATR